MYQRPRAGAGGTVKTDENGGVVIPSRRDTILKYIAQYTHDQGYPPTVREIAHGVGLRSTSTVAYYLRDLEERGELARTRERSRGVVLSQRERGDAVPLVGRIAAGTPILATEHVEEMVSVPSEWFSARVDFALKVVGDSMVGAGIHDGDIAFIHQQPAAEEGEIVAALLDDEATLKRLSRTGGRVALLAENPRYAPIIADEVTILGKLVGIVRTF